MTTFSTPEDELPPEGVRLLDVLSLERLDRDLFRSTVVFEERWSLFGGQVAAQALLAAGRTVDPARLPHSLHGGFLRPGDSRRPVVFAVERDRDGGSFSARRVVALQEGEVILNLSASFALPDEAAEDETTATAPDLTGVPAGAQTSVPPRLIGFEQWLPEQPHALHSHPTRAWFRCTEQLPSGDAVLDAAVLTYVSDIFTGHGSLPSSAGKAMSTIDHALWLHRPARAGDWVLMALHSRSISRGRGFYTGELWAPDGRLVASLAQETLYRVRRPARRA